MSSSDCATALKRHKTTISKLFGDPRWTDLEVSCNGHSWKVHRNIVCSQSAFFEKAAEGGFIEAITGIVELPNDDAHAVQALLEYYYCGGYQYQEMINSPGGVEKNPWSPLAFAVVVHTIAEKYGALPMMELANVEFTELLPKKWRSQGFVDAVEAIYATSPATKVEMRLRAGDILVNNYSKFKDGEAFENCQAVFQCADFVTEVLHRQMNERIIMDGRAVYTCAICVKSAVVQMQGKEANKIVERHCAHCGVRLPENAKPGLQRARARKIAAAVEANKRV